jgi:uncharacterized membrane protein (DUF485 family)
MANRPVWPKATVGLNPDVNPDLVEWTLLAAFLVFLTAYIVTNVLALWINSLNP